MPDPGSLAIIAAGAFLPAVLLLWWVRNLERYNREPVRVLVGLLGYGATLGVVAALLLTSLVDRALPPGTSFFGANALFFATVLIAPPVEELSKGLGLLIGRRDLDEPEDGIIHGAAIGLGFAATENFAYGDLGLHDYGLAAALATVGLRVVTSMLLHAGSSATLGFGYGLRRLRLAPIYVLPGLYLVAVLEHALYNGLVLDDTASSTVHLVGFAVGVILAGANVIVLGRLVRVLDAEGAPPPLADARVNRPPS
ncbi:MAG: PrsW family intramembrane metalloprotease [Thermoplasmatota archaeon]